MGEVAERFEYGLNASAVDFDGVHKYIRITDIDEDLRHFNESNLTSPDIDFVGADNYLLKRGDILFARTGASVGKTYIHNNDENTTYFAGFLIRARLFSGYVPEFIYQNTLTMKYNAFIKIMSQRSGQPGVNAQEYANYLLWLPTLPEQTAIGNFFRTLDNTITLYKRKLEGLRALKKGYLQQMFPQAGERVPRVRFAAFSGDWQERKLGEVVERITRRNVNLESTLPLTISAQYGLIDQTEFFDKQVASRDVSGYFLVKNGDFAYNKSYSNGYPWGAVKRLDRYKMGVLSTLYIVFKPVNVESEFLVQYYETDSWHTEVAKCAAEGARNHGLLNITPSDFFDTAIMLPREKNEQTAIGGLFQNFDGQIAAQSAKLERIQQLKAAYLKKMFF